MKINWIARTIANVAALSFVAGYTLPAAVAVPDGINYQGYLTSVSGAPVDTAISITFVAYNVEVGGVPLWSQTDSVIVDRGLFSVTLGTPANPFPAGIFSGPVYIGLFVAGEEMLPRRQLTSAPYAFQAGDSDTLDGFQAVDLDQSGDVVTLQTDVSGLQTTATNNDSRITSLEATGADITAVNAGAGLTGGGSSGAVSVGVAAFGINASMMGPSSVTSAAIADGQVTSSDIADGTVGPLDVNQSASYTINGLTNTGSTLLQGALTVQAGDDIVIRDNFNGFRWYDDAGTTQFGAILMRSGEASFFDANQSRYIFRSDADGIGIGTTLNNTGYAVSVPSLSVAGQTSVGLERVLANYALGSTASCAAHGNLTCYYGSATVVCPVGKRVLGGGTTGSNARYGAVGQSYPLAAPRAGTAARRTTWPTTRATAMQSARGWSSGPAAQMVMGNKFLVGWAVAASALALLLLGILIGRSSGTETVPLRAPGGYDASSTDTGMAANATAAVEPDYIVPDVFKGLPSEWRTATDGDTFDGYAILFDPRRREVIVEQCLHRGYLTGDGFRSTRTTSSAMASCGRTFWTWVRRKPQCARGPAKSWIWISKCGKTATSDCCRCRFPTMTWCSFLAARMICFRPWTAHHA